MIYISGCNGLKFDKSLELDYILAYWTSIDAILGKTITVGLGFDNEALGKEAENDEKGAQVEFMFNPNSQLIGGALSLSSGYGKDMPVDWEVNIDGCLTNELYRTDLWKIFTNFFGKDIGDFFRFLKNLYSYAIYSK